MLADPCADPGIFARVVQSRLSENSSDNGFCLFFSMQWFISKKTIKFRGGGCPTYSRGGGGAGVGGPNANSRNP